MAISRSMLHCGRQDDCAVHRATQANTLTVRCGIHAIRIPSSLRHSVDVLRSRLCHAFSIPPDATVRVNGRPVIRSYVPHVGDTVEFIRPLGNKGVGRIWTEEEFCAYSKIDAATFREWIQQGLRVERCRDGTVRIVEDQADAFFARKAPTSARVPPDWEGLRPDHPITNLADLADWLEEQLGHVRFTEHGGPNYRLQSLEKANIGVRNAWRLIAWFAVTSVPDRPAPAQTVDEGKCQIDDLIHWATAAHEAGWRPKARQRKQSDRPDDSTAEVLAERYLREHPNASIRTLSSHLGLSIGKVHELDAWAKQMAKRKAGMLVSVKSRVTLSDEMLAVCGKSDDPAAKVMEDDAIWHWLLDQAPPKIRAELHKKNEEERARLIDSSRDLYKKAHRNDD